MAYSWQNTVSSGKKIELAIVTEMDSVYDYIINNHCGANCTDKASNYSDNSSNCSYDSDKSNNSSNCSDKSSNCSKTTSNGYNSSKNSYQSCGCVGK